jgi:hypothetical protein
MINPPLADFLLPQMRCPSLLRGWRWLCLGCVVSEQRRRRGCGPPHQRQFSERSAEAVPCRAPNSSTLFPRRPSNCSSCSAHVWSKSSRSRLNAGSIDVATLSNVRECATLCFKLFGRCRVSRCCAEVRIRLARAVRMVECVKP